jgi:hypothetical protein
MRRNRAVKRRAGWSFTCRRSDGVGTFFVVALPAGMQQKENRGDHAEQKNREAGDGDE